MGRKGGQDNQSSVSLEMDRVSVVVNCGPELTSVAAMETSLRGVRHRPGWTCLSGLLQTAGSSRELTLTRHSTRCPGSHPRKG